jgi:hypothetical protein
LVGFRLLRIGNEGERKLSVWGKLRNVLLIWFLAVACCTACTSQKARSDSNLIRGTIDVQRVLAWLPADTETLLVANGPFWMSNFQIGGDYQNREVTSEEVEKHFEALTLNLLLRSGLLEKHFERKKVLLALECSRHFRPPAGLGESPFEGGALAIFKDDLGDSRDSFMEEAAHVAVRMEEIEGRKVAVFEEPVEQDIRTIFVTFPQNSVVLAATNKQFLGEMLARMQSAEGQRALPDTLPEWKYVNKRAKFWGLRHFARLQDKEDPTSPFGGRKSGNIPDEQAIGLTYQCNPDNERKATLTYLSGEKDARKIEEERFPSSAEVENRAGLHIQYRDLEPGVIQSTYSLDHSEPLDFFFFVFMGSLGHVVYL